MEGEVWSQECSEEEEEDLPSTWVSRLTRLPGLRSHQVWQTVKLTICRDLT